MSAAEGKPARTFRVLKDNGESWNMNYTKAGVTWERADESFGEPSHAGGPRTPLGGRFGAIEAITSIGDTAANIGVWWEFRQQRLLNEAMNEETRRISWLADMIARWGEVHSHGNQLDFRVSEYLAREAAETMNAIVANKRIALPQSMLYELESIQDTFRSFRSLILTQFETLAADSRMDLEGAVRKALPNGRLNMDFIRALGKDPSAEWIKRLREKTTGDFEKEIASAMRDPSVFLSQVFPSTETVIWEPPGDERNPSIAERLIALLDSALPLFDSVEPRTDASERRDAFRELSLISAEVSRVKALNSAWLAASAIVAVNSSKELQVQVSPMGIDIGLASPQLGRELLPPMPRDS